MVKTYTILIFLLVSVCAYTQTDTVHMITFIETAPHFEGDLTDFIKSQIHYPQDATNDSIEGMVIITFWIDTLGGTTDHKIVRGIRDDLNEEAMRITKLIKFEKPAMQKGQPIKVKYTVPVEFKLSETKKKSCKQLERQ